VQRCLSGFVELLPPENVDTGFGQLRLDEIGEAPSVLLDERGCVLGDELELLAGGQSVC